MQADFLLDKGGTADIMNAVSCILKQKRKKRFEKDQDPL